MVRYGVLNDTRVTYSDNSVSGSCWIVPFTVDNPAHCNLQLYSVAASVSTVGCNLPLL